MRRDVSLAAMTREGGPHVGLDDATSLITLTKTSGITEIRHVGN